jgi:twitching motility protein PilT
MELEKLVALAASHQASDLHLEVSLRPTLRVHGELTALGEPVTRTAMEQMVRTVVGQHGWEEFVSRRSHDGSMTLAGVRCRVNAMHTMRGLGLAIRLLPSTTPTMEALNLHPDLRTLVTRRHGLILVSGPTGSGKSSTLAALLQEINTTQARHIITVEHPIEYRLKPVRSFIRQREVGSDTLSVEQALLDALREDPDVIMVGEMRDAASMRLTLNAAETGHLVLATLHSASVAEALQRIVLAFPAEIQSGIAAQLADCLVAVICQQLRFREDVGILVPECEIALSSSASRSVIRQGEFAKLTSVLETGAADGMFTWERYRRWLATRKQWSRGGVPAVRTDAGDEPELPPHRTQAASPTKASAPRPSARPAPPVPRPATEPAPAAGQPVFEIDLGDDLESVVAELVKDRD